MATIANNPPIEWMIQPSGNRNLISNPPKYLDRENRGEQGQRPAVFRGCAKDGRNDEQRIGRGEGIERRYGQKRHWKVQIARRGDSDQHGRQAWIVSDRLPDDHSHHWAKTGQAKRQQPAERHQNIVEEVGNAGQIRQFPFTGFGGMDHRLQKSEEIAAHKNLHDDAENHHPDGSVFYGRLPKLQKRHQHDPDNDDDNARPAEWINKRTRDPLPKSLFDDGRELREHRDAFRPAVSAELVGHATGNARGDTRLAKKMLAPLAQEPRRHLGMKPASLRPNRSPRRR